MTVQTAIFLWCLELREGFRRALSLLTLFSGGSSLLDLLQALNICFPAECEEGDGVGTGGQS